MALELSLAPASGGLRATVSGLSTTYAYIRVFDWYLDGTLDASTQMQPGGSTHYHTFTPVSFDVAHTVDVEIYNLDRSHLLAELTGDIDPVSGNLTLSLSANSYSITGTVGGLSATHGHPRKFDWYVNGILKETTTSEPYISSYTHTLEPIVFWAEYTVKVEVYSEDHTVKYAEVSGDIETTFASLRQWDWNSSNGTGTAAQTRSSYTAATTKANTIGFYHEVWDDLMNYILDALRYSGHSVLDNTDMMLTRLQPLTAAKMNAAVTNVNYNFWTWRDDPDDYDEDVGRISYLGRLSFRRGDIVFGRYIIELAKNLNIMRRIYSGTRVTSLYKGRWDGNLYYYANNIARPSRPMIGYRVIRLNRSTYGVALPADHLYSYNRVRFLFPVLFTPDPALHLRVQKSVALSYLAELYAKSKGELESSSIIKFILETNFAALASEPFSTISSVLLSNDTAFTPLPSYLLYSNNSVEFVSVGSLSPLSSESLSVEDLISIGFDAALSNEDVRWLESVRKIILSDSAELDAKLLAMMQAAKNFKLNYISDLEVYIRSYIAASLALKLKHNITLSGAASRIITPVSNEIILLDSALLYGGSSNPLGLVDSSIIFRDVSSVDIGAASNLGRSRKKIILSWDATTNIGAAVGLTASKLHKLLYASELDASLREYLESFVEIALGDDATAISTDKKAVSNADNNIILLAEPTAASTSMLQPLSDDEKVLHLTSSLTPEAILSRPFEAHENMSLDVSANSDKVRSASFESETPIEINGSAKLSRQVARWLYPVQTGNSLYIRQIDIFLQTENTIYTGWLKDRNGNYLFDKDGQTLCAPRSWPRRMKAKQSIGLSSVAHMRLAEPLLDKNGEALYDSNHEQLYALVPEEE